MAVELGVSSGFVSSAPVDDPAGTSGSAIDDGIRASKCEFPALSGQVITQFGFFQDNASVSAIGFSLGLFQHDPTGDSNNGAPGALVDSTSLDTTTPSTTGWETISATSPISVTASTTYWVSLCVADHSGNGPIHNYTSGIAAAKRANGTSPTSDGSHPSNWSDVVSGVSYNPTMAYAIYALYEPAAGGSSVTKDGAITPAGAITRLGQFNRAYGGAI